LTRIAFDGQNTHIPMRVRCGFTFAVAADANIPIYVQITSGVLKGLSFRLRVRRGERTHFTIEPRDDVADTLLRNCPRLRQELVVALFAEDRRLSRAERGGSRVCRWWRSTCAWLARLLPTRHG